MKKFSMILLVLAFGCKSVQTTSDDVPVIFMSKTACLGTCPDYDISIFSNGAVLLNARQFVEMEGAFKAKMSKEALNDLIAEFTSGSFDSFKTEYKSNRTDLPTTKLTFNHEGEKKTITDYDGAPEELKSLEAKVHSLIESLNWKKAK